MNESLLSISSDALPTCPGSFAIKAFASGILLVSVHHAECAEAAWLWLQNVQYSRVLCIISLNPPLLFVKALGYSFQSEQTLGAIVDKSFVNMHFLGLPAGLSAPLSSQHSPGGNVIMAVWHNFIWNTSLPSRLVAVKSPPRAQSYQRCAELPTGVREWGSEGCGGKRRTHNPAIEKEEGGNIQLWIQLYIIFFLVKVFTEQGAMSGTSCGRPEGGSESGNYPVPLSNGG